MRLLDGETGFSCNLVDGVVGKINEGMPDTLNQFLFIESALGFDFHYCTRKQIRGGKYEFGWFCWHLSSDFFKVLKDYGRLPVGFDFERIMLTMDDNDN